MQIMLFKHGYRKRSVRGKSSVWWPFEIGHLPDELESKEAFMDWVRMKFGLGEYLVKIPPEKGRQHKGLITILKFDWKPRHPRPFVRVDLWRRYLPV
jgi:hypothetical protein